MTPERWRRITELAFAARQREAAGRGAFLDRACASDASLRAEVDALLAADGKGSEPSDALTVSRFEVAPLEVGAWLGPYRIEALLGTGGMGEVYRARDPRLGRDVALKVLPVQLAADPARRERLLKEARAAAALNHPNICTVHEIGEAEGRDYLVFELIEGRTLSALRRTGGLSLTELLDLFVPLSEALEFAHRRGIVHRDLKPSNMMVSSLGLPKILDFGLAKDLGPMSERAGSTRSTGTGPGVVLGTAGYMSPEQALGHPTDARTDVFAFGCVLYEMAGGRRAFEGDSFVEVTYAVLHEAPKPLAQLRPDLPPVLTDVVSKSLLKSSEERCRSMSEVTDALRAIRTGRSSLATRTAVLLRRPTRAWRRGLTAILVAGALLGGVVWTRRLPNGNDPLPRLANPAQVTVAASLEDYPTWSPDGRTLAYESNQSGGWDIWVTNAAGGQAVDRTADYAGDDRYPSWSPDGRQIAFWSDRGGGGYQLMPAIGGAAQHLASTQAGLGYHFYSPPQWSADGTELAYVMYEPVGTRFDSFVEILSLATREAKRLPLPGAMENRLDLSWSPDGPSSRK